MERKLNSLLYKAGLLRYQIDKEKKKTGSDPFVLLRLRRLLLLVEKKLKFPEPYSARRHYMSPVPVPVHARR